jgi:hypothetical protein
MRRINLLHARRVLAWDVWREMTLRHASASLSRQRVRRWRRES